MSGFDEPMESTEEDVTRVRLPNIKEGEMFGIADQLLGASKIRVMCEDLWHFSLLHHIDLTDPRTKASLSL